ncbi:DUF4153 domain-containing protein [Actinomadura macrotermitis]|uniref:DUF4173 domain-containing protein n=1 Tax=Actinomadura macrotermitis TaxID=2585200 RepID=A0A7K0BWL0_9ACTN|nr:DUF4173 domain-containing protein [Actinomadura macrotermitis]MQY05565.1 hypothetical protein [Actinomadura macrotermitis]
MNQYPSVPAPLVPPRQPFFTEKVIAAWKLPARRLSPVMLGGVLAAAVIGSVALGDIPGNGLLGLNLPLTALAVAAVVLPVTGGRMLRDRTGLLFCLLALALTAIAALRDAEWITALGLLLALPVASYAMTGGRSWAEVLGGGLALPAAGARMLPWAVHGVTGALNDGRGRAWPVIRTGLIAGALLLVFGALFAGADAAFSGIAAGLVPDISPDKVVVRVIAGTATALLTLALVFLALAPPPLRMLVPRPAPPAGRWAWAVPIAALDLLFLAFCAIQASVLLASDKDRLLRSTGLTYAQYARQGFFQLVVVTVLVLAVIAFAVRHAPRDRMLVRALLGALCALTLVVVAVALRRLYLYEETYGWTRLRLWVHAFELWLGLVVVLVAAAGLRLKAAWLPRAVAASGAAGLLALAALNPDAFIAERNVTRHARTGKIDIAYLRTLSADAVPALDRLPEPVRSCALLDVQAHLSRPESALSHNLSRTEARALLKAHPPLGHC